MLYKPVILLLVVYPIFLVWRKSKRRKLFLYETSQEPKITVGRRDCCQEMSTHQRTECQKPANKSKDHDEVLDRISSLPDEIIGYILSCLPPKSAVGTSLLSKRWKYLFRLTTKLYFEEPYLSIIDTTEVGRQAQKESFKKFVHVFLALHQKSTIKEFSLKCYNIYDNSDFDVWISVAILKEVQELYLDLRNDFYRKKEQRLPFSLFNSRSLQVLKIYADTDLVVPKTVCLPNVKVLDFTALTFDDDGDSIGRLLCGCTSLEVLTFNRCEFEGSNSRFSICSPTVKYLTFKKIRCIETIHIDAPSLQNATFKDFVDTYIWHVDKSLEDESTATYLSLQQTTFRIPAYLNLASSKLGCRGVNRWKDLIVLLCNSPRLETVIFDKGLIYHYKGDEDRHRLEEWFKESKVASFSIYVEVIEVHRFSGNEIELYLLEHLLQMAIKLKRLILYKDHKMKMENELQMAKQLLMLPRASDYCQIELV